jgi:hypothetical protein
MLGAGLSSMESSHDHGDVTIFSTWWIKLPSCHLVPPILEQRTLPSCTASGTSAMFTGGGMNQHPLRWRSVLHATTGCIAFCSLTWRIVCLAILCLDKHVGRSKVGVYGGCRVVYLDVALQRNDKTCKVTCRGEESSYCLGSKDDWMHGDNRLLYCLNSSSEDQRS